MKQGEVAERIRKAAPRLASLQYPQPLGLPGVQAALDPGTTLLAYSVGKDETLLFAVRSASSGGDALSVFSLSVSEAVLRAKVQAFREAIQRPRAVKPEALAAAAAELYDLLVRPAESAVEAAERVLLSPDGPLHSLPFAALVRRTSSGPRHDSVRASYLVEWKPLHVVASATVYAELKRSRREAPSAAGPLVAFGNPRYPPLSSRAAVERVAAPDVRSAMSHGLDLAPLPASRHEVDAIAAVFAGRSRKYIGAEATEERARSIERDVRYVHFACHAFVDPHMPLNSGLALSIRDQPLEGEENGLLQAWEIFDHVRLDADLVTLSACNTGVGEEMGSEGLMSLTRAFQYAGARSVLATLWPVSDRSTSQLMTHFYRHLHTGQGRDQALRAAQVDLIRSHRRVGGAASGQLGAGLSHPLRWAAFQLSGDWR